MHLFFENIAPLMFSLWSNSFFKDEIEHKEYNLSRNEIKEIGETMASIKKYMPLDIGKAPRDIAKHHAGFKAIEWRNWIIHFSIPLLIKYLPERYNYIYILFFNFLLRVLLKLTGGDCHH